MSPSADVPETRAAAKHRLLLTTLVALMLVAGGFRWLRGHSHQPPLVFLPLDADQPSPARMLLDRAWFWLRMHVIGKGKTIVVRATVFEPMDRGVRPFDLPPVGAESNRVQLWTLTAEGLEQVKRQLAERRLNPVTRPAMQMLSGMQGAFCVGTMWTGNGATGFVGVEMEVLPRTRGNWVDLTSKLKVTEALTNAANAGFIQTNVLVRMRARTPPGGAVFGLSSSTNGKSTALLLVPQIQ